MKFDTYQIINLAFLQSVLPIYIRVRTEILFELIVVTNQLVNIIDGFFKYTLLTFVQRRLKFKKKFGRQIWDLHQNYCHFFHFLWMFESMSDFVLRKPLSQVLLDVIPRGNIFLRLNVIMIFTSSYFCGQSIIKINLV